MTRTFRWGMRLLVYVMSLTTAVAFAADDYCYKGSYGRGVGTIPTACKDGKEYQTGLCYDKCKAPYTDDVGPVCWQPCPSGYLDTGALCHIDKPLLVSSFRIGCHWSVFGECIIPDMGGCPSGYTNAGLLCGLNTPSVPPGFKGLTGLDIMKNSYGRGAGTIPTACKGGKEYQTGLCYDHCKANYDGNGPVCWNTCPKGYVQCGAGCATSSTYCATVTADQVMSTLGAVAFVATLGASGAATTAAKGVATAAEKASMFKQLVDKAKVAKKGIEASKAFQRAKQGYDATKPLRDAKAVVDTIDRVEQLSEASDVEEGLRIASGFDPTGFSQVANAFGHKICNEVK
ncbi:MAG: hypothetical protein ABL907_01845 [Hyphomicrobium sp.]